MKKNKDFAVRDGAKRGRRGTLGEDVLRGDGLGLLLLLLSPFNQKIEENL
jgi:hypothetical protein